MKHPDVDSLLANGWAVLMRDRDSGAVHLIVMSLNGRVITQKCCYPRAFLTIARRHSWVRCSNLAAVLIRRHDGP